MLALFFWSIQNRCICLVIREKQVFEDRKNKLNRMVLHFYHR